METETANATNSVTRQVADLNLDALVVSPSMSELLQTIVTWAVELLQADAAEVFLWDEEKHHLLQSIGYGSMERYIGLTLKSGEGIVGTVYKTGQPMIVHDYDSWPGRLEVYRLESPNTDITVPMIWQGRIIGVLGITANPHHRTFSEEDIRPATLFANLAALAIQNHRMCDVLQDRAQQLKTILDREVAERTAQLAHRALQLETNARLSQQLTGILELDDLVATVVELIREAFGYYHVQIYLLDTETNLLLLQASTSERSPEFGRLGIDNKSLNGLAALTNQEVLVNDVSKHHGFRQHTNFQDTKSELVIPLRKGQQVLGTLDVQSNRLNAFQQEDIMLLQSLGDQIAIAIDNANLYERNRELAILEERNRLARDLHDAVTQMLFSASLIADVLPDIWESDVDEARRLLQEQRKLNRGALAEMRTLLVELRPEALADSRLVDLLHQLADALTGRAGSTVKVSAPQEPDLPPEVRSGFYRIAQETFNNISKHANADNVSVDLAQFTGIRAKDERRVRLTIKDDGCGFDLASISSYQLGLRFMQERARAIGAGLMIETAIGNGTSIQLDWPQKKEGKNDA
ncbi:MAG: GAF domain-containing sensor histidine kinase [Anaerolineales bacterium]|nr:GAF domain-containing sensor histidine kinase [Anaerolineales bacterium]